MTRFALVDQYMGIRLQADLARLEPGQVVVIESGRRLGREQSYGYVHALWWLWLADGRSVVSVPPGAGSAVATIVEGTRGGEQLHDSDLAERLRTPVDRALLEGGVAATDRVIRGLCFACNQSLVRRHRFGECRPLVGQSLPPAEGLRLPIHCFPDGIAYGVIADGKVVSVAYAHRAGVMEDQVADLGVETAPAYRRRGYAKTSVSAVVGEITRRGGEARYGCSPKNLASVNTARSVGFRRYGVSLILAAPAADV